MPESLLAQPPSPRHTAQVLRLLPILFASMAAALAADGLPLSGDLFVHDPSTILKEGSAYHLFGTGFGITTKSSSNLLHWTRSERVFSSLPSWTTNRVPGSARSFWAPDALFINGEYRLYYSVSTFGKQQSAIALATTPTLDDQSPRHLWSDRGAVIESHPGDPFNAIDPGVLLDRNGRSWMAFGSFWRGVFVIELDAKTGKRLANSPMRRVAWHDSIEAAALHRHGEDCFLFVNWGACCRGTNSTYEVRVGRSKQVTGPYLDRTGKDLVEGGGTLFLKSDGSDIGPGHIGVLSDNGREFVSYHVYDATKRGWSQLRLRPLNWSNDGWPMVKK